jgi:outer membrane protein
MKRFFALVMIPLAFMIAKEMKIGFVNSNTIFEQYQATAAAEVEFNDFVNLYRDSAAVLRNNISVLNEEFESQKLVLSEEARIRKLDEIDSLKKSYDQFLQNIFGKGGKIEQKNDELMTPLMKKINEAVAKVAEQEGFQVVLDLSEGVFYASSELDITNLVIDELNLEYGPAVLPGAELKEVIAIFPFREENSEAAAVELGQQCQDELYNASLSYTQQFKMISKNNIKSEILKRGLGRNVPTDQALLIARTPLLADYIIIGDVSKFVTKIEYTMYLIKVESEETIMKKTSTVLEEIRLSESLKNDLIALLQKIEEQE